MKALLLAEKPSLMRDIEKAYKKANIKDTIDFMSFRGHVVSLAEPDKYKNGWDGPWRLTNLPMIPDEFLLSNVKGTTTITKDIKDRLKNGSYDYIINACDSAREGELIFYNFYESLPKKYQLPVKRLWASDTTEETLKKALEHLIDGKNKDLLNLKESAKLRARWDWLLGLNMTRLFTITEKSLFIVGRVMTATLYLVELRRRKIENFKPIDYFELEAVLNKDNISFSSKVLLEDDKIRSENKKRFEEIKNRINKEKKAKVTKIYKNRQTEYAKPCYNLTDLQRDAAAIYKYSPAKTLQIAQNLYEKHKILSYPRTESRFIPKAVAKDIAPFVKEVLRVPEFKGMAVVKSKVTDFINNKRYVDDKKITDHHALLPTKEFKAEKLKKLSKEELNIFMLVLKRFLSIFMKDYLEEKTNAYLDISGVRLRATGTVLIEKGFYELLGVNKIDTPLPSLKEGEFVDIEKINLNSFKTKPPINYTEGTLLSAMENVGKEIEEEDFSKILKETGGLGTPATRAEIIEKLKRNGYIELRKNFIHPTEKGINIIKVIEPYELCKPEITADWETKLAMVENGDLSPGKEMDIFKEYIKTMTDQIMNERDKYKEGTVIGKCPRCGERVITGRYGYACENYKNRDGGPTCDFSIGFTICGAEITPEDIEKMLNGEKTEPKFMTFKSGKTGKPRLYLKNGDLQFDYTGETIGKCPICGKDIKESDKFYMCENYLETDIDGKKKCGFIVKKHFCNADITKEDAMDLINKGSTKIKDFVWKSGNKGRAKLVVNKDEKKIDLEFENNKN